MYKKWYSFLSGEKNNDAKQTLTSNRAKQTFIVPRNSNAPMLSITDSDSKIVDLGATQSESEKDLVVRFLSFRHLILIKPLTFSQN